MDTRTNQIQAGWSAIGSDGETIGDIEEVGPDYLLVTKGLIFRKDLYVPVDAISQVDAADGRVMLSVPKDQVEEMGWSEPPPATTARAGLAGVAAGGTADRPVEGLGYTGRDDTMPDELADRETLVGAGSGATAYGATGATHEPGMYGESQDRDGGATGAEPGMYGESQDRDRGPAGEAAGAGAGAVGGAVVGGAVAGPPGAVVGGVIGAAGGAAAGDAAEDDDHDRRARNEHVDEM